MIYDVNENRFYDIKDVKDLKHFSYKLLRNDTLENIVYFNLKVDLSYINLVGEVNNTELLLPIEFNTNDMEELEVEVKRLEVKIVEEKGVDLDFDLAVNIKELFKEEIVANYQQELIENLPREEEKHFVEEIIEEVKVIENTENSKFNLSSMFKSTYQKYKVITIKDEDLIDKISLKYKVPVEKLYALKKEGNRVIVYDEQ